MSDPEIVDSPEPAEVVSDVPPTETEVGHPLPEIFISSNGSNANTQARIAWVFVSKCLPGGKFAFVDAQPIENITSLKGLESLHGAGDYQLQGRGEDRRHIVKQVYVSVGIVTKGEALARAPATDAKLDIGGTLTALVAALTPIGTAILTSIRDERRRDDDRRRDERERDERRREEERKRDEDRRREERERDQKHFETTMNMVTELTKARIADYDQAMGEGGSSSGRRGGKSDSIVDALALLESLKESGLVQSQPDTDSKLLDLIGSAIGGMNAARDDAVKAGVAAAAAAKEQGSNGSK